MDKKLDLSQVKFSHYDIKREIKMPNKLSNELAYLCGILAGYGHISREDSRKNLVSCGGNPKDEKEFYDIIIKNLLKDLFNINVNPRDLGDGTYGFRFESKAAIYLLTKVIGLPRGKKYEFIKIPTLFLQDRDLVLEFIRGLFDTDFGFCLTKKYHDAPYYPQICFDSKSKKFTKEVWQALKDFGLNFNGKVYRVYDKDERAKAGFTITYRFDMYGHKYFLRILKLIKLRHPKHIKKYQEWLEANKDNSKVKRLLNEVAGVGFEFVRTPSLGRPSNDL